MPLVLLNRDPKVIPDIVANRIGYVLVAAVAEALSVDDHPDGKLVPNDIEVIVRDVRPELDVNYAALAINVFANDFPSRKANLDERRLLIQKRVGVYLAEEQRPFIGDAVLCNKQAFVWILLAPASFGFL